MAGSASEADLGGELRLRRRIDAFFQAREANRQAIRILRVGRDPVALGCVDDIWQPLALIAERGGILAVEDAGFRGGGAWDEPEALQVGGVGEAARRRERRQSRL